MKTEAQIKHKLSQVRFRHLKREVRTGLSRRPENCRHNGRINLPVYGPSGICLLKTEGAERVLCDEILEDRAPSCDAFECLHSKGSLKKRFDDFLKSSDRAHIAEQYPDMAALLWVLDVEHPEPPDPIEDEDEPVERSEPVVDEPVERPEPEPVETENAAPTPTSESEPASTEPPAERVHHG